MRHHKDMIDTSFPYHVVWFCDHSVSVAFPACGRFVEAFIGVQPLWPIASEMAAVVSLVSSAYSIVSNESQIRYTCRPYGSKNWILENLMKEKVIVQLWI